MTELKKEISIKYNVMVKENPAFQVWDHFHTYDTYEEAEECIDYHYASYPVFKIEKVYTGPGIKIFMEFRK